ncbi:hypothetical protein Lalb_Chr08g0241421 [Lupinus albus]|uniref:Uncharacterized protein n=1 Tax=Lupinus albus TaxID=3870 RepID=A0A6A4Q5J5_LUPAL|nr:hypothetical protein Lalb_Chr08g0241421 [Lupinus albus]
MGNVIDSFASGFGEAVGKLFNSPIEFLSGKSCSSVCGPTWDFVCYIENFCVANLFKLALVLVLVYIVLLFLYLLHKLGICGCFGRTVCKMIWSCFSCCFHVCEYSCTFLCVKLQRVKRRRRRIRVQKLYYSKSDEDYSDESLSYHIPISSEEISRSFSRRRGYKNSHLRKSLRPRNYNARVEISRNLSYKNKRNHNHSTEDSTSHTSDAIKYGNHRSTVHDIKVTRTSKFARKGVNNRTKVLQRRT